MQCAKYLRETKEEKWLKIGICAAVLSEERQDYRDVLMHLAELYVTAEEVNIDPEAVFVEFKHKNFGAYAIVKERQSGAWKLVKD